MREFRKLLCLVILIIVSNTGVINVHADDKENIADYYNWWTWNQIETGKEYNTDAIEIGSELYYLECGKDYVVEGYADVTNLNWEAYDWNYSDYAEYISGLPSKIGTYSLRLKGIGEYYGTLYIGVNITDKYRLDSYIACRTDNEDLHMYIGDNTWQNIILRSNSIKRRKKTEYEDKWGDLYNSYEYEYYNVDNLKYGKDFVYSGYYTDDEYNQHKDSETLGKALRTGLPNNEGLFYIRAIPTENSIYKGEYYFGIDIYSRDIVNFNCTSETQMETQKPYSMGVVEICDYRINDSTKLVYGKDYTCEGYVNIYDFDGDENEYIEEFGDSISWKNGIPTYAGSYILKLKGIGSYFGHTYIKIDIVNNHELNNYSVTRKQYDDDNYIHMSTKDNKFWSDLVLRFKNFDQNIDLKYGKDFVYSGYYLYDDYWNDYYDDILGYSIKNGLPQVDGEYYIRVSPASGSGYKGDKYFKVYLETPKDLSNEEIIEMKSEKMNINIPKGKKMYVAIKPKEDGYYHIGAENYEKFEPKWKLYSEEGFLIDRSGELDFCIELEGGKAYYLEIFIKDEYYNYSLFDGNINLFIRGLDGVKYEYLASNNKTPVEVKKGTSKKDNTKKSNNNPSVNKVLNAFNKGKTLKQIEFGKLKLNTKGVKKNSVELKWKKIVGAKKYVIYGNICGKGKKYIKIATVNKLKHVVKKISGKKLKKGTNYKFTCLALDQDGKVITAAKEIYVATTGGKFGNIKEINLTNITKKKLSLKKGKTYTIKYKLVNPKDKSITNYRGVRFESSDSNIAKVDVKSGKVTAKKKGKCKIFVYSQNGCYRVISLKVN